SGALVGLRNIRMATRTQRGIDVAVGDLRCSPRAPAHEVKHACQRHAKNDSREPPTLPHCVILAGQISILQCRPRSLPLQAKIGEDYEQKAVLYSKSVAASESR